MENPLPGPNKAAWLNALPACTFFLQTKLQDLLALSSAFLSSLGIVNYYKVSPLQQTWGEKKKERIETFSIQWVGSKTLEIEEIYLEVKNIFIK